MIKIHHEVKSVLIADEFLTSAKFREIPRTRVASAKFLGVIFQDNFKMDLHVNSILSQCNQKFYLLKLLRSQGMSAVQLEQIVQAIIVSRIRYALPAWSGFLTVELMNKLQSTLSLIHI